MDTAFIKTLASKDLRFLESEIGEELRKREQQSLKRKNICPVCFGVGDVGTEQDHEPCKRCKATGKYFPEGEINIFGVKV